MEHLKLVICYHCQALAEHLKPACPLLNEAQFCANCGQRNHSARDCTNRAYCLRCGGDHPAYARICPIYRKKFTETFAMAKDQSTHGVSQPNNDVPPASPLNVPDSWVALSDAVTAALSSTDTPRDFLTSVFSTLKANSSPRRQIIRPFKYNIDEWSQSTWASISSSRPTSEFSYGEPPLQHADQDIQAPPVLDEPPAGQDAVAKPATTEGEVFEQVAPIPLCLIELQDKLESAAILAASNVTDSILSSPAWTDKSNRKTRKKKKNKKQNASSTNSPIISKTHTGENPYPQNDKTVFPEPVRCVTFSYTQPEKEQADTKEYVLPADESEWRKLFDVLRLRIVTTELSEQERSDGVGLLPYQHVISYVHPSEQVTIFQQLCLLTNTAHPNSFT